jgi:hypothetical protein
MKILWEITFMTDYPYSSSMVVEAATEDEAWKEFEKQKGYKRDEYCFIKLIT